MISEDILKNLNLYKNHKVDLEEKIEKLEKQLDYIHEFRHKYRSCKENFNYSMHYRKQNLAKIQGFGSKVNIAQSHYLKMNDMLNGNQFNSVINKVEDIEIILAKKTSNIELEISKLKQEMQSYETQINNLHYELSNI
ncbi:hypothetical protein NNC19_08035 [Clostridium sp. SHJSY1]|uniref:hypothetical protein n=1 Tax=Clostridium sp. SHJSY1 TaxID=2942483 RepID=UPI002876EDEF|nr:hypothetical protein [Clostridium sp. SHJSY1]MDS0525623.1 hypothetical protein [Clostridium sp. SHJSY1]